MIYIYIYIYNTGLLTACEQNQDGTGSSSVLILLASCQQPVGQISLLCVLLKSSDGGQRNCPKHVDFYSKNKFEKLVHLVGFIIKICHDVRSPELQIISFYIREIIVGFVLQQ